MSQSSRMHALAANGNVYNRTVFETQLFGCLQQDYCTSSL